MRSNYGRLLCTMALAAGLVGALPAAAGAQAVLDTGTIQMGVSEDGGLGFDGVGLNFDGVGDAIIPGCLCEGWGVAANGSDGFYTYGGTTSGFDTVNFVDTGAVGDANAVSTVLLDNGLEVTHTYSSAAGGSLFKVEVTLENTTGATMTDIRYERILDWDVPPDHFSDDFTTVFVPGVAPEGDVLHTSLNPFHVPLPMSPDPFLANQNRTDEPGDLGGDFILGFGSLAAGATHTFTTYIGAARTTEELLAAFGAVGIEAYTYSFDDDSPATFGWGFAGIGLPPIGGGVGGVAPEPATLVLFGAGLVGAMARRYRRR